MAGVAAKRAAGRVERLLHCGAGGQREVGVRMIALLQRVSEASVTVNDDEGQRVCGAIGRGLLVFVGVERGDTPAQGKRLLERILASISASAAEAGVLITTGDTKVVESGNVADAILDTACELDSRLIVFGNKGKGAIRRFLLDSVATRLEADVPAVAPGPLADERGGGSLRPGRPWAGHKPGRPRPRPVC